MQTVNGRGNRHGAAGGCSGLLGLATAVLGYSLLVGLAVAEPLFENSVVSNDIDFIMASDPAVPACLRYLGQAEQEMPGALDSDKLMASDVYQFEVTFLDQSQVGIWVHPSVGSKPDAENFAGLLLGPLGRLPAIMRQRLSHVVVHSGYHAAFAEHLGHFFVLYADNIQARIGTHDLEETVFHESVHATLDADWSQSAEWLQARESDGQFITDYAAEKPEGEDLAETALFGLTYLRHRERLPLDVVGRMETLVPARLAVLQTIFSAAEPELSGAQPLEDCIAP
ncbi:MAG: hypothetical protein P0Y65_19690 [Candidatus Devosia phytovorans]|uniref:Uncharacterized protein n=1 Tax=Candidatus Devosia phytovorans TaxID=3121372 RepID=A0AAJ6AZP9_9HYPH|nr:hypothetical protein [Devosia sp.]WEK04372.1 MAG: hypothetical protein P0Y65_19690 [Devosia sp.]